MLLPSPTRSHARRFGSRLAATAPVADHPVVRARRGPPPRLIPVPRAERAPTDRALRHRRACAALLRAAFAARLGSVCLGSDAQGALRPLVHRALVSRRSFSSRRAPRSASSRILHPMSAAARNAWRRNAPSIHPPCNTYHPPIHRLIHNLGISAHPTRLFPSPHPSRTFAQWPGLFHTFGPVIHVAKPSRAAEAIPRKPSTQPGFQPRPRPISAFHTSCG